MQETNSNVQNDKQNASDDQVQEQAQSNCENQEAAQSEASSEQATAAAGPQTTQEAAVEPSVEELLEAAKAENAKLQDLYMRALAEMENSRRRAEEAVEKAHKFGVEKFAKNMLPVLDSLEKALELAGEERNPMIEGIEATYRQMVQAMQQGGMTEINPVGEKFDPAVHQAIAMVPAQADQVSGQVAQVFQRGWLINGRVLRAAMVSVIQ